MSETFTDTGITLRYAPADSGFDFRRTDDGTLEVRAGVLSGPTLLDLAHALAGVTPWQR